METLIDRYEVLLLDAYGVLVHSSGPLAGATELIKKLKKEGIGIFLISHDLHDVFDLSDRVSVMKNGKLVGTRRTKDVTKDEVLGMIILGKLPEEGAVAELGDLH